LVERNVTGPPFWTVFLEENPSMLLLEATLAILIFTPVLAIVELAQAP